MPENRKRAREGVWNMELEELQGMIDRADTSPELMLKIGRAYAAGEILRDITASEAWLLRAAASGNNIPAAQAMELLLEKNGCAEKMISDQDYEVIYEDWKNAGGEEKAYLEYLLKLREKEGEKKE